MAEDFARSLREARKRLGVSQAELARRASLSVETVRAYEQARRKPGGPSLTAILDALELDRTEANNIRLALGLAPDRRDYGTPSVADQFTVEELERELATLPWPAFAANEMMEVVAANDAAQQLWGVEFSRDGIRGELHSYLWLLSRSAHHQLAEHRRCCFESWSCAT